MFTQSVEALVSDVRSSPAMSAPLKRGNSASRFGLKPIGESSSYAVAVGVHKDLPDVVVKVVNARDDGFYWYALAIYRGIIKGPHLPVILSVTEPSDQGLSVVAMERLYLVPESRRRTRLNFGQRMGHLANFVQGKCPDDLAKVRDLADHMGLRIDAHSGNWMYRRKDRHIVLIDPFSYRDDRNTKTLEDFKP